MADRTVSVKLIADAKQYIQGLDEAARKTRDASTTIEQRLAAQRDAFNQVGAAATAVGVLALAGVTAAVAAYAQFDAAMSGVQAATHESAENMQALSDAALEAGQRTVFSATESAAAIENLARAGVSTAEILGGALDGALDLAAAGGIEVADAAEIAASAMTQFSLAGDDVTHVADLLAAGAGKAQGGVAELGDALNQSGLVAAQMGLSVEETVGSLTAFASAGLIGSDAGTSFRAMLLRLANPTKESATLMDELGLSFYDSQGAFIGVEGMAGQLQERLADLTQEQRNQALAQIFGQDAIRTSAILYEQGAEGVRQWTEAVDEQGYAAETAAIRLDNLKGDIEQLGGAFETLMINMGAGSDGPLRASVQRLTDVVDALANMDPAAQAAITGLGSVVGFVGLAGGAAMLAVPKIAEFRVALDTLGISSARADRNLGKLARMGGLAVGIGTVLVAATALSDYIEAEFLGSMTAVENAARGGATAATLFNTSLQTIFGEGDKSTEAQAQLEGLNAALEDSNEHWQNFLNPVDAYNAQILTTVGKVGEALGTLAQSDLEAASEGFRSLAAETDGSAERLWDLLANMGPYRDALVEVATAQDANFASLSQTEQNQRLLNLAMGDAGPAADVAAEGIEAVGSASEVAAEQASDLYEQTKNLTDLFFGAQDAMAAYEQSIDDIAEAMTGEDALVPALLEGGEGFNLAEQAGRDAAAMLQGLVVDAQGASEAMHANGAAADELAAYQDTARQRIYETGIQMGLSEDAAREYADRLVEIPGNVSTDVSLDTAAAEAEIQRLIRTRSMIVKVAVDGSGMPSGTVIRPGQIGQYASGGRIPGYAPGYDDRLGFLSNGSVVGLGGGEYIMPTRMTDKYLDILEQMRVGAFPGYASGGRVGMPTQQSTYRPVINVAAPAGGGGAQVQVDVHPTPGVSEVAIGQAAASALSWALR